VTVKNIFVIELSFNRFVQKRWFI